MWSSSTDDCSTVLDLVCDYSVHGSNTTPPWEEVDGGWPHIGPLFHQERWGEWVLFRLQRSVCPVQVNWPSLLSGMEWIVPLWHKTDQLSKVESVPTSHGTKCGLACLLVISTAVETSLLNWSVNFCPVIRRCTANTHTSTVVSSSDFTINSWDYLLNEADSFSTSYHCLRQLVYKIWRNESAQHNIGTLCSLLLSPCLGFLYTSGVIFCPFSAFLWYSLPAIFGEPLDRALRG